METWKILLILFIILLVIPSIIGGTVYAAVILPNKASSVTMSNASVTISPSSVSEIPISTTPVSVVQPPPPVQPPLPVQPPVPDPISTTPITNPGIVIQTFKINGRYVTISKILDDSLRLDSREIQIYSGGINIATNNSNVKVTSTCGENLNSGGGGHLRNIVDGNINTSTSTMWSRDCQDNGNNGFKSITVDLGKNYSIDKVVVHGSSQRLVNKNRTMTLTIKDNDNKTVYQSTPILTNNLNYATYQLPNIVPIETNWS